MGTGSGGDATLLNRRWGPHGRPPSWRAVVWRKGLVWLVLALMGLLAASLARDGATHALEAAAIETKALGAETPLQFGAPFERIRLASDGHIVDGRIVRAARPDAPALLIFHGNGEAVSDWSQVQAMLRARGVSSMVFDYSGFGQSTGTPSVDRMRQDALVAYGAWRRLTPNATSHVVVGHSLGNAVMLDALADLSPAPSGVVVHAGFTSAREYAVRAGLVSSPVAFLLPDLWNNEAAISGVGRAGAIVLVMHGDHDEVIPTAMGRRLAEAAGPRSHLHIALGAGHDDFYLRPSIQEWQPLLNFVSAAGATGQIAEARN